MPRLLSHFGLQDPRLQSVVMPMILPVTLTAAATLTSPQLLQGMIIYNGAAGNITLPSAADLCNNIQGVMVGTSFEVIVKSIGAGTATVVAGTGGTVSGTATVATANIKNFLINFTNVTLGQEAYTAYAEAGGAF
jgi:hypothetical protein